MGPRDLSCSLGLSASTGWGPAVAVLGVCQLEDRSVPSLMHTHTHTCTGREIRRLKQCGKKTLTLTCAAMCFSHTQRSFAVICLFVCLFHGGISSLSLTEGSCGLRKILSMRLSEGEKSNQIKFIVSPTTNPGAILNNHSLQWLTQLPK